MAEARSIVDAELAAIELACSRFRPDSEILAATGHTRTVSPLLAELVAVALDAAARTDGAVDPTVGAVLSGLGYDRDLALVTAAPDRPAVFAAPDWRAVRLWGRELTVPRGVTLDRTCVEANTMSTASVVLGSRAISWLGLRAATARLVPQCGGPVVTIGGWPS